MCSIYHLENIGVLCVDTAVCICLIFDDKAVKVETQYSNVCKTHGFTVQCFMLDVLMLHEPVQHTLNMLT